jgi:hypothetical protein
MAELNPSDTIDVVVVTPDIHRDAGMFIETYRRSWFPVSGK